MKKLITFAATLVALPFMAFASLEIGMDAPVFEAVDTNGNKVALAEMKDDVVVLEWTNHECPFVKKFYSEGHMQTTQKTYTSEGVKWIRIISSAPGKQGHLSDEESNKIVNEKKAMASHTIRDESGAIGRAYDAKTTPHMYIINKGKLAYMGAMDDKRSPNALDIATATPHFTNALDNVLVGKEIEVALSQPYGCSIKY